MMNEHFGWRQGGRTAAVYTHLSGKQVDDQILAVFGKKRIDLETNVAVDVVRCLRCGLEKVPTAVQRGKCGFPLSAEAARKLLERRQMADAILDRLTSRPEFVGVMEETLAREGAGGIGGMTDGSPGAGGMERGKKQGVSLGS